MSPYYESVTVDVRHFTGAVLDVEPGLVTEPITAVYVDGRLDRIEWERERDDGGCERYVVPVAHVARLYTIEAGAE